jgi:hypothetical protein
MAASKYALFQIVANTYNNMHHLSLDPTPQIHLHSLGEKDYRRGLAY